MSIHFDNSYARELEGLWLKAMPSQAPAPQLIAFNHQLATELGLGLEDAPDTALAAMFSGNELPEGAEPLAQAYAGHQFGHFNPQLGDGRAILLGEVVGRDGKRRDIQLKGAGRTPFSRNGDGRAALGPVLREYIVSEAFHSLGIPATRALAAVDTGGSVYRETELPGAVLTRVAASHIRIGTFQFFASRGQWDAVQKLLNHAISRHDPDAAKAGIPALAFLDGVAHRQASLVAHWSGIGFVHGVMNTDNMSASGETIDFGPCAFIDHFDPDASFSSIDTHGRYAFSNQPKILQWNLARLAECLLPLIDPDADKAVEKSMEVVEAIPARFTAARNAVFSRKLGFSSVLPGDADLADRLLSHMADEQLDHTNTWRLLSESGDFGGAFTDRPRLDSWAQDWQSRLALEGSDPQTARAIMLQANPAIIARNHRIEEVIVAGVDGNFAPFHALHEALKRPYAGTDEQDDYRKPPLPHERVLKTFCGT